MTPYQVLCLVGIPSIFSAIVAFLMGKVIGGFRRMEALERGVQAILRDRLYQAYNHFTEKGYAPLYARENFENMYQQYHNLGKNGVMDDIRKKFLELPSEQQEEKVGE
jgi:hypothetical protein